MKLLNKYIAENGKDINFSKASIKENTRVAFTRTNYKYKRQDKIYSKGDSYCLHCGRKYNWAVACPNLEEEHIGQLHTNVGTLKDDVEKEDNTTGVSFLKPNRITITENN